MKTYLRNLSLSIGILTLAATSQAQTITGWGADNGDTGGVVINDLGGGSFTASNTPTASATFRAALPTAVTLVVGQSLTVSGTFSFPTSGAMGGGGFRIGLSDYASIGTLSSGVWSTGPNATGYFWGLPTGGSGVTNPNGGEITGHGTGNGGSGWFSGNGGGYSVSGTGNNNAGSITPNTYNFSLTLTELSASSMQIAYSMVGGTYSETGTVTDNSATIFTYNGVGFFANTSDTAFASGVTFSGLTETVSAVPEPASMTLLGLGALVGTFVIRRKK